MIINCNNNTCKHYNKYNTSSCSKYDWASQEGPTQIRNCSKRVLKQVKCNKCNNEFKSTAQDKNIICPACKSKESFSITILTTNY